MFKFTLCLLLSLPFFQTTAEETPIPDHFEPVSWLKEFLAAHEAVYRTGSLDPIRKFLHPGYEDVYLEPRFANFLYQKRQYESVVVNNVAHKFLMAKILDWEYPKPNVLVMLGRWDYTVHLEFLRDGAKRHAKNSGGNRDIVFAIEKTPNGYQAICTSELYKPFEVDQDEAKDLWKNSTTLCMEKDYGLAKRREWRTRILKHPQRKSSLLQETPGSEKINILDAKKLSRFNFDRNKSMAYALKHAKSYNPNYPKFESDCTNFASQILYLILLTNPCSIPLYGLQSRNTRCCRRCIGVLC